MRKVTLLKILVLFILIFAGLLLMIPQIRDLETAGDYEFIKKELTNKTLAQDPRVSLADLSKKITKNESILRSCHGLAHEIGRVSYVKYQDFGRALEFGNEICNSGYMHGVIEGYFGSDPNIFSSFRSICSKYFENKYTSWQCYHGIGHGFMYYTENDLPKSLTLCRSFESDFARSSCINGVFMENFNTDQKIHVSRYLNPQDPFYPCPSQAGEDKSFCYLFAPVYFLRLNNNNYARALEWCKSAEESFVATCAVGVGSQAIKDNIFNPLMVEQICSEERKLTAPCISGMISLYINHHGSLEQARALCPKLTQSNKEICETVLEDKVGLFQRSRTILDKNF